MQKKVIVAFTIKVGLVVYAVYRSKESTSLPTAVSIPADTTNAHENTLTKISSASQIPDKTVDERYVHNQMPTTPPSTSIQPVTSNQTAKSPPAGNSESAPNSLGDQQKEERLGELMNSKGSETEKYVEVQSIVCDEGISTVDAMAKDSPERFQMAMAGLLSKNPWLGDTMKIETAPGQRGVATFKFFKE